MGLHAITTRGMRARTACVCPNCDRGLDVAERSPWVDRVQYVLCDECETGGGTGCVLRRADEDCAHETRRSA